MDLFWVLTVVFLGVLVIVLVVRYEIRLYNKGICKCGSKLKSFDMDSQGSVGLECDSCGRSIWVHGIIVDLFGGKE